jgi:hypothetical protein
MGGSALPQTWFAGEPLRVAIHQPNLLPRLKVLQKLACADVWCVLDAVQYCSREWQNRGRIVAIHGGRQESWLTVPVHRPRGRQTLINEVSIADPSSTPRLIEQTLVHAFRRAPFWTSIETLLSELLPLSSTDSLVGLCVEFTRRLLGIAGPVPSIVLSSSLAATGKSSELLAAICRELGASAYLADSGARIYLQESHFTSARVLWQSWTEPRDVWPGIKSWRDISGLDYLARVGPEPFSRHLTSGTFTPVAVPLPRRRYEAESQ